MQTSPLNPSAFMHANADRDMIDVALKTVREHLGMEVAYLSEFVGENAIFRAVDAPGLEDLISPGDAQPLSAIYCNHILQGRLPNVIPDTLDEPIAVALDITHAVPIRSHVSVPVHREDGSVFGMFCCLSPRPNSTLNDRDLGVMKTFAGLAQSQLQSSLAQRLVRERIRLEIDGLTEGDKMQIALQPIFPRGSDVPCGFEALARFDTDPYRPPNEWFDAAKEVDQQVDLELLATAAALRTLPELPEETYLSINASPAGIASGRLREILAGHTAQRLLIEVTEHEKTSGFASFDSELQALSAQGFRIAIDDVGAGYSGLSNILKSMPQVLKLDMDLVRDVHRDPARQALVQALVAFGGRIGSSLVAEGIEMREELDTLSDLGVDLFQGFYLGRPETIEAANAWFATAKAVS